MAKLSLPKDVSDRASRPSMSRKRNEQLARQLAKRSSPPIVHH